MTPNPDTALKLTRARAALLINQPFFGTLALRLKLVPDNTVPTLAVDGKHIFYNEKFVDGLSMSLTKSALVHEVGHCVFDHISRRGSRDPQKWNQAGDFVINDIIQDAGFELGEGWLHNPAYKGMSADQVYNLLPPGDKGNGGGAPDPLCDIRQGSGSGDAELDRSNWRVATVQAATAAKAQGKLPDSMKRFINEITSPKVDWRAQLRRFVTEVSKDDYTWQRPNRRYVPHGFYLPSLYSESMGEIVIAVDTSGSVGNEELKTFAAEINAVRDSSRPLRTHVIYCDADVAGADIFEQNDEFRIDARGGGGTAFSPVFDYVEEHGIKPACLVYLTDGYGQLDFPAPDYPTMWCMTTDQVGVFGETIKLEN